MTVGFDEGGPVGQRIERTAPSRGLHSAGNIILPAAVSGDEKKTLRNDKAIEEARRFETDRNTIWRDGSALPGETCAAAIVGFVEGSGSMSEQEERIVKEKVGMSKRGEMGGLEPMGRGLGRLKDMEVRKDGKRSPGA